LDMFAQFHVISAMWRWSIRCASCGHNADHDEQKRRTRRQSFLAVLRRIQIHSSFGTEWIWRISS
jgi:hypothetical protein